MPRGCSTPNAASSGFLIGERQMQKLSYTTPADNCGNAEIDIADAIVLFDVCGYRKNGMLIANDRLEQTNETGRDRSARSRRRDR